MEESDKRLSEILVQEKGEDVQFPIGMNVLAIDANIVCLKYLVMLLQKCQYKVTATTEAAEAIKLLKDKKEDFDIVITDIVGLVMDGFKLLEIIGLGMDIPVVLVSANDNVDVVKKGVREGAAAYLLKPVRLQEVKNLWQHVLRKRFRKKPNLSSSIHEVDYQESSTQQRVRDHEEDDESRKTRNPVDNGASSSSFKKKPRVTWSKELHLRFVQALEQLGETDRVPNNILKLMNAPGLTRENVASHLQKHRDALRKKKAAGVGKLANQRNYYDRYPTKESTIYSSINQINYKASNLTSPASSFLTSSQFQYPQLGRAVEELQGNEYPRSTWTAAGSYFPVPEFKYFDFPSGNSNLNQWDGYLGFGTNDINPYYLHQLGSNCLSSTSQTSGNCSIEVGGIPQQAPPISWPCLSNSTAGQYSQPQFDKESSHSSLIDDNLGEIFKQFQ